MTQPHNGNRKRLLIVGNDAVVMAHVGDPRHLRRDRLQLHGAGEQARILRSPAAQRRCVQLSNGAHSANTAIALDRVP
jgi:hypothetical protein